MSELKAALLGTIAGGVISAGVTWMQGSMAMEKDLVMEKRQKLEMMVDQMVKIASCTASQYTRLKMPDNCLTEAAVIRFQMLSQLYFPELTEEANAFIEKTLETQFKMTKCYIYGTSPSNMDALEQCRKELRTDSGAREAGAIMKKIQAIAKSL